MPDIYDLALEAVGSQRKYSRHAQFLIDMIDDLREAELPPILDLASLSTFSDVSLDYLSRVIVASNEKYRTFEIPKRTGGKRKIEAPQPNLLKCQRWILENILHKVSLNQYSTAYRPGFSILNNVIPHVGSDCLLKLDLKDFFPSIGIDRVISVFANFGYTEKMAFELASICCLNGRLAQGAATSPALSNIIAKRLDNRIGALVSDLDLTYTRYSDDIAISGQFLDASLIGSISSIVREEGFILNDRKTILYGSRGKKIVTGISVGGDKPRIPRASRRKIRQEYYELFLSKEASKVFSAGGRDVFFLDSLVGKLQFWSFVEPESSFPREALAALSSVGKADVRII